MNETTNNVFSQGMKARDMWGEMVRKFAKKSSSMTPSEFYLDRFALFIDLRSIKRLRNEIGPYEGWRSARD